MVAALMVAFHATVLFGMCCSTRRWKARDFIDRAGRGVDAGKVGGWNCITTWDLSVHHRRAPAAAEVKDVQVRLRGRFGVSAGALTLLAARRRCVQPS